MKKPIVAILYDFDSTLAKSDMQNFGFIPSLGMTPAEFWGKTTEYANETGMERTLSYLYMMVKMTREKGIKMTKDWLKEQGKAIEFFPGVLQWFERINKFGEETGVKIEHYLVSSGNKEIVDGTPIAKEFKKIYACEFLFDAETKEPIWPRLSINFTQKTQYFYRVSKGVLDAFDDSGVNEKKDLRIPKQNIVYIGDGMTDIPAMVIVKNAGGKSIAVYPSGKAEKIEPLVQEGRVNYAALADYRENKQLDKIIKLIIQSAKLNGELAEQEK